MDKRKEKMVRRLRFGMALAAVLTMVVLLDPPATAYAFNVMPIEMVEMYTTSGTPVYATPDVFSPVVVYIERFTNVRVFGITDNGFYQDRSWYRRFSPQRRKSRRRSRIWRILRKRTACSLSLWRATAARLRSST